jgi:hypothetical protein
LAGVNATAQQLPAPASQPAAAESADEQAAVTAFQDAVAEYVKLRIRLRDEIPPLVTTPSAAEINEVSDALARAVQRARRSAKRGDFFTPAFTRVIQKRLRQSLSTAERARLLNPSEEDPRPMWATPKVHARFPAGDVLATTPPSVLQHLPPLPAGLEFRFVGNTLILRDSDAALILDFLAPAIR